MKRLSSCLPEKLTNSKNLDFKSIILEVLSTRKISVEFKALLYEFKRAGKSFGSKDFEKLRKSKMRQGFDDICIDLPMDKQLLEKMELSGFQKYEK